MQNRTSSRSRLAPTRNPLSSTGRGSASKALQSSRPNLLTWTPSGFRLDRVPASPFWTWTPKTKVCCTRRNHATAKSPYLVETGGGYHAYYRYGGERRHIRPWGPDLPIDVLGNGYAVGAPSVAAKGQYRIIHGTLDDLKTLPPLSVMLDELRKPIPEGRRNQSLFRTSLEQAAHADDFETLMDVMRTRNMDCTVPLTESELEAAAHSAWKYEREGRNLVGRGKAVVMSHDVIDRLDDPDAFYLMALLKRHHWGRDFVLTKAMASALGWTLPRWRRARNLLVRFNVIACIHEGGLGPNDPPVYAWADLL